jgi:endonuclease IV
MYFILGKKDEMLMTFSDTKDKRGKKRRHMSIGKDRQREGKTNTSFLFNIWDRRGSDRMVVGFATT